jgi:hypothetical protein
MELDRTACIEILSLLTSDVATFVGDISSPAAREWTLTHLTYDVDSLPAQNMKGREALQLLESTFACPLTEAQRVDLVHKWCSMTH